jgi:hypothetical protein
MIFTSYLLIFQYTINIMMTSAAIYKTLKCMMTLNLWRNYCLLNISSLQLFYRLRRRRICCRGPHPSPCWRACNNIVSSELPVHRMVRLGSTLAAAIGQVCATLFLWRHIMVSWILPPNCSIRFHTNLASNRCSCGLHLLICCRKRRPKLNTASVRRDATALGVVGKIQLVSKKK